MDKTILTRWKFYTLAPAAFDAMYEDCVVAKRSIDLEMFILKPDSVGARFVELLERKAREGILVRVLLDMVGSFAFVSSPLETRLRKAGVVLNYFNHISPWRLRNFTSWYFRDHRKILIVDSQVGYTGGVNLFASSDSRRDTQVRIVGAVVTQMQAAFDRMWENTQKDKFIAFGAPVALEGLRFLTHSPHRRERHILRVCMDRIRHARRNIFVTTPYFVPSVRLLRRLVAAARRGVDVRILLPSLSDVKIVDIAGRSFISLLLSVGVRIYFYQPPYLHAKVMTIDDTWAMIGSFNFDSLSFVYDYEAGIVSEREEFSKELSSQFFKDLESSNEVKAHVWHERSLLAKIAEVLTWPIHFLL